MPATDHCNYYTLNPSNSIHITHQNSYIPPPLKSSQSSRVSSLVYLASKKVSPSQGTPGWINITPGVSRRALQARRPDRSETDESAGAYTAFKRYTRKTKAGLRARALAKVCMRVCIGGGGYRSTSSLSRNFHRRWVGIKELRIDISKRVALYDGDTSKKTILVRFEIK